MQRGLPDQQGAGPVVTDEEDRAAALPDVVAGDDRAFDRELVVVTVAVNGPAAARRSSAGQVAPWPIAWLPVMRLSSTAQWTPMLLSAPPLEHAPPRNMLYDTYTGRFWYWLSARMAVPPSYCWPVELPSRNVMFWMISLGVA